MIARPTTQKQEKPISGARAAMRVVRKGAVRKGAVRKGLALSSLRERLNKFVLRVIGVQQFPLIDHGLVCQPDARTVAPKAPQALRHIRRETMMLIDQATHGRVGNSDAPREPRLTQTGTLEKIRQHRAWAEGAARHLFQPRALSVHGRLSHRCHQLLYLFPQFPLHTDSVILGIQ